MTSLHQTVGNTTKLRLLEIANDIYRNLVRAVDESWGEGKTEVSKTICADEDIKELPVSLLDGRLIVFHHILNELNNRQYRTTFETPEPGIFVLHVKWVFTLTDQERNIKVTMLDKFRA